MQGCEGLHNPEVKKQQDEDKKTKILNIKGIRDDRNNIEEIEVVEL